MLYDPRKISIDSVQYPSVDSTLLLHYTDKGKGYIVFDLASYGRSLDGAIDTISALSLNVTALEILRLDTLKIIVTSYDKKSALTSYTEKDILFNYRPIVPEYFSLSQNYPNPFNPSTTIEYQLPKDTRVSLKVYNVLGQEVATLASGDQKAGYYSVRWNAGGFASGVYFCRLHTNEYVLTKKMLLLK
jgi:hypothetical protein